MGSAQALLAVIARAGRDGRARAEMAEPGQGGLAGAEMA